MKKTTTKKNVTPKKVAPAPRAELHATPVVRASGSWSFSTYVYWLIILFFIAASFYLLGHSQGKKQSVPTNNVEITEEALLQSGDYYEAGKNKLMSGDVEAAVTDLTAAIDAAENNVDAYILRGEAHMQSGDYESAIEDFNAALALDAQNSIAYYDRALVYTRMEDYQAALNDINAALAARAERPNTVLQMRDLYARRGQLNLWLKNWEGAIADYTNSLALPDGVVSPSVYAERAEAYTAMGNYVDAVNDYASAVRVISEQIQGATTAASREQLSSNAMSYFEKSAALNLQMGNVDGARSDLQSSLTIAVALNDTETINRLQSLLADLTPAAPVVDEPVVQEPADVSDTYVAETVVTEPVVTEPVVTEPVVTEPVSDENPAPVVTETENTDTNM